MPKPLDNEIGIQSPLQKFYGHFLRELSIDSFGSVHGSHAASPDLGNQPIWPKHHSGQVGSVAGRVIE